MEEINDFAIALVLSVLILCITHSCEQGTQIKYKQGNSKQILIFRAMETNQCEDVLKIIGNL